MGETDTIRVGRDHECDVRVTDISVSRYHAAFKRSNDKNGGFFVTDNSSKFGTICL